MIHPDKACTRTDEIKGKEADERVSEKNKHQTEVQRINMTGGGEKGRGWWEEETKGGISLLLLGACDVFQPSVQPSLWARN